MQGTARWQQACARVTPGVRVRVLGNIQLTSSMEYSSLSRITSIGDVKLKSAPDQRDPSILAGPNPASRGPLPRLYRAQTIGLGFFKNGGASFGQD